MPLCLPPWRKLPCWLLTLRRPSASSFPTEAALRAKQRIRQHQRATGDKPAVTHQRKFQEVHHDDCGDDFSSLHDADAALLLHTKEAIPPLPPFVFRFAQSRFVRYFTQDAKLDEHTYMALTCLTPQDFEVTNGFEQHLHDIRLAAAEHYMTLSSSSCMSLWQPAPHELTEPRHTSVLAAVRRLPPGKVELVELFGGKAGCTSLAVRRNLHALQNIDLCCGVDISDARTRHEVYQLLKLRKPLVVITAPPCTAFSGWARLNRTKEACRDTWNSSHNNGIACSKFAAAVIELQMAAGRHFVLENPRGSMLFDRPEWQRIRSQYHIEEVHIDQCALGLHSPLGHPIRKATTLWASSRALLSLLHGLRDVLCRCQKPHRQIAGSEAGVRLSRWAQQWPVQLCRRLVDGMERLIQTTTTWTYPMHVFPATARDLEDLPPPEESHPDSRGSERQRHQEEQMGLSSVQTLP
eukprot:6455158-Amphidinium_carterae.2